MYLDLENLRPLWARKQGMGDGSERLALAGRLGATLTRGGWPDGPFSNIARKNFSVLTWLWPNLVHLLGVPVDDRQPILKKIRQF